MPTRTMRTIPEPKAGSHGPVVPGARALPVFRGVGDLTYLCGGCHAALIADASPDNVFHNLVIRHPLCGAFNAI